MRCGTPCPPNRTPSSPPTWTTNAHQPRTTRPRRAACQVARARRVAALLAPAALARELARAALRPRRAPVVLGQLRSLARARAADRVPARPRGRATTRVDDLWRVALSRAHCGQWLERPR